jgi:hypothetical protein
MPVYHKLGTFLKKDTQFEKPEGGFITNNFWNRGFSGNSALYVHRPTQVKNS